jgi:tetratricopeptide (TPR) repeat protein
VLLHTGNTLLLFGLLIRLTGKAGRSAVVAGLFALHPLHVESVAWIAERKDVLSTFFGLWTLWAYARYVDRPRAARYLAALGLFALGLMSKPMLVTWPFVLLLLDYWPLKRVNSVPWRTLLREKVPFLALAAASAVVTFLVQRTGGAVSDISGVPLALRLQNALVSYAAYLDKMLWPTRLAVMYPYADTVAGGRLATAVAVLAIITYAVWRGARRFPYLATGWLWYVGTLVPVIGLVQVGTQRMADRYTYIPYIGLFVFGVWGVADWAERQRISRGTVAASAVAVLGLLAALTARHLPVWRDSEALYLHALKLGERSPEVFSNLGVFQESQGRADEAIGHYREAARIRPDGMIYWNNLGLLLTKQKREDEAIACFRDALRVSPDYPGTQANLGAALLQKGRSAEAVESLKEALRLQPGDLAARNNLGLALSQQGRIKEAEVQYRDILDHQPGYEKARNNLGLALAKMGREEEAIACFEEVLRLNPDSRTAHFNLGQALVRKGRSTEALGQFQQALRLQPETAETLARRGTLLAASGQTTEAVAHFLEALQTEPDQIQILNNLAWILATVGDPGLRNGTAAVAAAERAVALGGQEPGPSLLDTLAAAYAEAGRFEEAARTAAGAERLLRERGQTAAAEEIAARRALYEQREAYRDPPRGK